MYRNERCFQAGLTTSAGKTDNVLVNVEQTGANDYWGMLHTFPLNEIMKARIYDLESMLRAVMEAERKTGKQMYYFSFLISQFCR